MDNFTATYKQLAEQKHKLQSIINFEGEPLTRKQKVAIKKARQYLVEVDDWMQKLREVIQIDN
uniref:Uncharacterized protein n=1 Tax=viral metagenome TaxID=1070528 RepID=A0A6M3LFZ3_9ZZZZ